MKFCYLAYRSWAFDVIERISKEFPTAAIIVPDTKAIEKDFSLLGYPVRKIAPSPSSLEHFKGINADWFILCGWSWMISDQCVDKWNFLGMHPSKLPKYRGGSPIQNQIINGEKESAATIFDITHVVDAGAIYAQIPFSLEGELSEVLARMVDATVQGLKETLPLLGKRVPRPQDESQATNSWRRVPSDSELSLSDFDSSTRAYNKIRCLADPYPNAFVVKPDGTKVNITRAKPVDGAQDNFCNLPAFFEDPKAGMNVVCKDGTLIRILEVAT